MRCKKISQAHRLMYVSVGKKEKEVTTDLEGSYFHVTRRQTQSEEKLLKTELDVWVKSNS